MGDLIAFIRRFGSGTYFNRNAPDPLDCTHIDCDDNQLTELPQRPEGSPRWRQSRYPISVL
jgi:hypothetical protein